MPVLSHLWQRFLLTSALLVGFALGAATTIFGASNTTPVNVSWWVFHLNGVPLWTIAVIPLAIFLVTGTLYHWVDGLHQMTEHHRHRRRVNELEAEVASLRGHLDHVLEMPDHSGLPAKGAAKVSLPPAEEASPQPLPIDTSADADMPKLETEPAPRKGGSDKPKRAKLAAAPEPTAEQANGQDAAATALPADSKTEG